MYFEQQEELKLIVPDKPSSAAQAWFRDTVSITSKVNCLHNGENYLQALLLVLYK